MPVDAADIKFFKSAIVGSDGIASLGGAITSNELTTALLNDLFDDVLSSEATSGRTEYRCVYLQNKHATLTLRTTSLFIVANDSNPGVNCAIGLDPAGLDGVATTIADETGVPAGVTFSEPTTLAPLSLGDLAADEFYAF